MAASTRSDSCGSEPCTIDDIPCRLLLGSTVRSLVGEPWHELLRTNGQPKSDVCGYCE